MLVSHTEWGIAHGQWLQTEKMDCYKLIDPNPSEGTHSDQYWEKWYSAVFKPLLPSFPLPISHLHLFHTNNLMQPLFLTLVHISAFFPVRQPAVRKLWCSRFVYSYWCYTITLSILAYSATAAHFLISPLKLDNMHQRTGNCPSFVSSVRRGQLNNNVSCLFIGRTGAEPNNNSTGIGQQDLSKSLFGHEWMQYLQRYVSVKLADFEGVYLYVEKRQHTCWYVWRWELDNVNKGVKGTPPRRHLMLGSSFSGKCTKLRTPNCHVYLCVFVTGCLCGGEWIIYFFSFVLTLLVSQVGCGNEIESCS